MLNHLRRLQPRALGLWRGFCSPVDPICELCGRDIPPAVRQSVHHLVPRGTDNH
jgi:hypothetical protein